MTAVPMVSAREVVVEYRAPGRTSRSGRSVQAVAGVSFDIAPGETMSLVGESGCGKTSLGRAILGVVKPSSGTLLFKGQDLHAARGSAKRDLRRRMQAIFQNPYQSLNPRMRVGQMLSEPIVAHKLASRGQALERAAELLELVGLKRDHLRLYPHEFSGGQRQRLSIARALSISPEFLVCDEPTSALDVSVRAQILNLLADLRDEMGLTYLLITHDLSIVGSMSDSLAVMYLGRIVEIGATDDVYQAPRHPYTLALLSAVPIADPVANRDRERILLGGDVPSPLDRPRGCGFRPRCWLHEQLGRPQTCLDVEPELAPVNFPAPHRVACHFSSELSAGAPGAKARQLSNTNASPGKESV